jgi:23S rRNA pseudouridine1911/1915/1917 synthase
VEEKERLQDNFSLSKYPHVVVERASYAVVYKPSCMHSVPLKKSASGDTLLDWYAGVFPGIRTVRGRQAWEGGALHRLDYETEGLVLFAKTQAAFGALQAQQENGDVAKEYAALCLREAGALPADFPPQEESNAGIIIKSAFRPYGPGRKAVRPVLADGSKQYCTEVLEKAVVNDTEALFRVRIRQGFRHQIRCHLAWLGHPLVNDALYGGGAAGTFSLCAYALSFVDPDTGERQFAYK